MKKILTLLTLAILSFGLAAFDAEARRFGGGKSIGKQREAISPQTPPKSAQTPPAASAPAAAGNRWMGPLWPDWLRRIAGCIVHGWRI